MSPYDNLSDQGPGIPHLHNARHRERSALAEADSSQRRRSWAELFEWDLRQRLRRRIAELVQVGRLLVDIQKAGDDLTATTRCHEVFHDRGAVGRVITIGHGPEAQRRALVHR